ncbi:hypothetical protein NHX12_017723 [Muraenolepis orangiensis]|uniref:Uncharacterized protein n=1 Tax=Muraenolepis orangiensis TaxID=630683 RepID=A0A9Q0EZY4_9TELE|nr:hypothetical protein NHX12_017723 [Muraenolepis orangiensis]
MADRTARPLPQEGADNGADVSGAAHTTADGHEFSREDTRHKRENTARPRPPEHMLTEATAALSSGTVTMETPVSFHAQGSGTAPARAEGEPLPTAAVVGSAATHTGELVVPTTAAMQPTPDRHTAATYPTDSTQRSSSAPSVPPPPPSLMTSPAGPRVAGATVSHHAGPSEDGRNYGDRQTPQWRGSWQPTDKQPPTAWTQSLNVPSESHLKNENSTDTSSVSVARFPSQRPVLASQSSYTDSELDRSTSLYGPKSSTYVVPDTTDQSSETTSSVGFESEDKLHTLSADPRPTATPTETPHSANLTDVTTPYVTTNTLTRNESLVFPVTSHQTNTSPDTDDSPYWPMTQASPDPATSTSHIPSSNVTVVTASDGNTQGEVVHPSEVAVSIPVPHTHTSPRTVSPAPTVGMDGNGPTHRLTDRHSGTAPVQTVVSDTHITHPTHRGVTAAPRTHTSTAHRAMFTHARTHAPTTPVNPRTRQPQPFLSSTSKTSPTYNRFGGFGGFTKTVLFSETLAHTEEAPGIERRRGASDEGLFMTSAPSSRSSPHGRPTAHTATVRAPGQRSPPPLPGPGQELHTTGTLATSPPVPRQNLATTQPPRFYIVPDQPAAFRVESIELLLQIIIEPYLLKAPGFSKLLGVWRRGLVVQSLLEFEARGTVVWLGQGGSDSLLECTGLAQAVGEGRRFRGSRVTNITVGGLQGAVCDWLLQCPAGFRCLAGDHFWFMGPRCDVRMTRAGLVGACLAVLFVLLTLMAVLALVTVRRYRAMLIQAKVNQTRSSYRKFNHFDELSGRFWLRSAAGSADSLDNHGFTRSDELLHLRALDRTCCYHDDTLSLASTCPSNGTRIHTVFPRSSQYGWRGSEASMVDCVLDSGKASDLSVCSWPVEPIHWTPFPLLQQLASHRPTTARASRTRSYCEGMELVDMGKSWTA